jgi:hypothetical protein
MGTIMIQKSFIMGAPVPQEQDWDNPIPQEAPERRTADAHQSKLWLA